MMIQNFVGSRIMQGSHCFSTALLRITEYYAKMGSPRIWYSDSPADSILCTGRMDRQSV